MAKYEAKICADFEHLMQYLDNSLPYISEKPVIIADYRSEKGRVCIHRFDATESVKTFVMAGNDGTGEISLSVVENETKYTKSNILFSSQPSRASHLMPPSIYEIMLAYNPMAAENENFYFSHKLKADFTPEKENVYSEDMAELLTPWDKLKRIFKK
ncbi:MAG: hypothetical protein IKU54_00545 [Oscillospiraceae bacterium]|nr:hypothetical protein [Oscillospiraceae bacterium]